MTPRAVNTMVRHAAQFAGLTARKVFDGYELSDLYGTVTEPLCVADVMQIAAASNGEMVIF